MKIIGAITMLVRLAILLLLILSGLLAACSSSSMNPMIPMMKRLTSQDANEERSNFDEKFLFLRMTIDGKVIFLASDSIIADSKNLEMVWYSAGREVIKLGNGRLVATAGLPTDWRKSVFPPLPTWTELSLKNDSYHWLRTRDVMPGNRFGIQDHLSLHRIQPPEDTQLKGMDATSLVWFEEVLSGENGVTEHALPKSRYGVRIQAENDLVVYAEQCVSKDICFSWQRWPVRRERMQ